MAKVIEDSMREKPSIFRTLIRLVVVSAALVTFAGGQVPGSSEQLALLGGVIYTNPTNPPIRNGVILVSGEKIVGVGSRASVRVPRGTRVIDCSGLTITSGFWNSHVHFLQRKWTDAATLPGTELTRQLQSMLTQYGFTTVFDTWSAWENTSGIRDRIESGEIAGPRIRSTGEPVFPKSGAAIDTATQASWGALGFMPLERLQAPRVSDASEAVEAATKLLDARTDGLKLYAETIGRNGVALPEIAIQALVKEAHTRGKPVFAHPTTGTGLMASVRAGVDVLAHTTPQSGPWDESIVAAMKLAGVALIPTLKLWRYELRHERISVADGFEETAVGQLQAWLRAGGVVLFGTDVGYMTDYDPTEEYVLMAKAGMNYSQILASLTTAPAERFGASKQLGQIAMGYTADLTILRNDPSKDIRALATVEHTVRDGKFIYSAVR
jgi:imidazolonepropionase-like amidohydrolase